MVAILEHMSALSDPIRCRMLMLLEKQELTVTEICAVLQMPQSSVSRHLKTLADDSWVVSRRDGTSRFYAMSGGDELDPAARRLWPIIREQVAATSAAGQDDRRLRGVLARRRAKSQEFFASAAAGWDRLRSDLFGDTFYLWGVLGLIDPAIYFSDPEIELAFMTLFGSVGETFFTSYREIHPIAPGFFEARRHLYNLYPLLVHVRLFGGGYVGQVERILDRFGA